MKKILTILAILLSFGAVLYQDQGRIFLVMLANHSFFSNNSNAQAARTSSLSPPYKDGVYTGSAENAFYGIIQVQSTIKNGKIANVSFLQAPNEAIRSVAINTIADPNLAQEAIQAQSPNVDIVSGATASSQAFAASLQIALQQAK